MPSQLGLVRKAYPSRVNNEKNLNAFMKKVIILCGLFLLAAGCNTQLNTAETLSNSNTLFGDKNQSNLPKDNQEVLNIKFQKCESNKYGYSFEFPVSWQVSKSGPGEKIPASCSNDLLHGFVNDDIYNPTQQIEFDFYPPERTKGTRVEGAISLEDYADKNSYTSLVPGVREWIKESKIDGERAFWYKEGSEIHIVTFHNSTGYEFRLVNMDVNSFITNRLISNFKFLE